MTNRWWSATAVLLVVLLLAYLLSFLLRPAGFLTLTDGLFGILILTLAAMVCLVRAAVVPAQRTAFLLIGLAAASFTAGHLIDLLTIQHLEPMSDPSPADIGYLLTYPLLLAAVIFLALREFRGLPAGTALDGVLGVLSAAAAGSILIVQPVLSSLTGAPIAQLIHAAYPIADLALIALVVGVLTLRGGMRGGIRKGLRDGVWLWLGSGMLLFAVADTIHLQRVAAGSYLAGTWLDGLWAAGLTLMAIAATRTPRSDTWQPVEPVQVLLLPSVFSLIGLSVLVFGSLSENSLPLYAVILSAATFLTALKRTALGFAMVRQLAVSRKQAHTDELTQLPNRRYFDEVAQSRLTDRKTPDELVLMMLDLDGFKAVNETFGHHAGDELLRQVGPRLRQELRADDLLARIAGDRFAMLLAGCDREMAILVANRLRTLVGSPFLLDGELHSIDTGIGIAVCPHDGLDLAVLMQRAGAAMQEAKTHRLGVVAFDPARHRGAPDRLNARDALIRHELILLYQPQFDLGTDTMIGVEALVRWQHPVRGLLRPDEFLPFFEQAGLMPDLTLRVLELGAEQVRQWRAAGTELQLSVNLAPSALLRPDLVDAIGDLLIGYSLDPQSLTVEITENAMMMDLDRSHRALGDLRARGIQLSLDDYGTGYCSLAYLRDLPLNEVKIDRSFVMQLEPGSKDAEIVASSVALAHTLGLRTVAEGVENEIGLNFLRSIGCEIGQGYLMGRPMLPDQVIATMLESALWKRAG